MIIHTFFLMGDTTPPGSPQAQEQGCTCLPELNQHGDDWDHGWQVDTECPVHAPCLTGIGRCAT